MAKDKIVLSTRLGYPDLMLMINGVRVYPQYSQGVRNHSPDGFQCGYGGSGPAQAALAILLFKTSKELAQKHYQAFKWEFVARWRADTAYEVDISQWLEIQEQIDEEERRITLDDGNSHNSSSE